jgi:hypothetical protein
MVFGSSATYSTWLSALILISYATVGGIRSVAFTDIIQILTFGLIIPTVVITVWCQSGGSVVHTLQTHANFDLASVFDTSNPRFYEMLILAAFFFTPCFQPAMFQRISMASSTDQVARSFKTSALICFVMQCLVVLLSIIVLSENPKLDPDNLMSHISNNYTYLGFKGLFATAIMAIIMSTADSLINTIGVIFANDLLKPAGFKMFGSELKTSKIFAFTSAIFAVFFALKFQSILDLILVCAGAYIAVVSIPFIFAILGFRSSEKSVLIAMTAAVSTFFIWQNKLFGITSDIDSCAPAVLVSIAFLFGSHYLLKQPGGWVGIEDTATLERHNNEQREGRKELIDKVLKFNFNQFFKNNQPKNENMYHLVGFISAFMVMINAFSIKFTFAGNVHEYDSRLILICSSTAWLISALSIVYPVMRPAFRDFKLNPFLWTLGIFIGMICVPTAFMIISNFAAPQLVVFGVYLIGLSFMLDWAALLALVGIGVFTTVFVLQDYLVIDQALKVQAPLSFIMLGMVTVAFARPRQRVYVLQELRYNKVLSDREYMREAIKQLNIVKQ